MWLEGLGAYMHRAFVEKNWIDSYLNDEHVALPHEVEARFFKILRIKPQEKVAVFDGMGRQVVGTLTKVSQKAFFDQSTFFNEPKLEPAIVLLQAAIEEAKMSECIKRGCEFGVDKFVIFNAEHSEKYCYEKLKKRHDRLRLLAIDACRQSGRLFVPEIIFYDSLAKALDEKEERLVFYGDPSSKNLLSEVLASNDGTKDLWILVGPEGGTSKNEIEKLKNSGFLGVRWSLYTLRSELASLAAVAIISAKLKRA